MFILKRISDEAWTACESTIGLNISAETYASAKSSEYRLVAMTSHFMRTSPRESRHKIFKLRYFIENLLITRSAYKKLPLAL